MDHLGVIIKKIQKGTLVNLAFKHDKTVDLFRDFCKFIHSMFSNSEQLFSTVMYHQFTIECAEEMIKWR